MSIRFACVALVLAACVDDDETLTSEIDEELTCDVGPTGALGNACVKAGSPLAITASPFASTTAPTIRLNEIGYGVRLAAVGGSNQGKVVFVAPQTGTYQVYLGSNVPLQLVRNGAAVTPSCTSSITSAECSYLRKVVTFALVAGNSVELRLGPTTASYVRLHVQAKIATPPVCTASDLGDEQQACVAANNGAQLIDAGTLARASTSAPMLARYAVYNVRLPVSPTISGTTMYGGIVRFKPPTDGIYELYYGTPAIPLRILGSTPLSAPATTTCSRYIPSSECNLLRRGTRMSLRASDTYYFEIGPDTHTHVRLTIR